MAPTRATRAARGAATDTVAKKAPAKKASATTEKTAPKRTTKANAKKVVDPETEPEDEVVEAPKAPKASKAPKEPKVTKAAKATKATKATRAIKAPKKAAAPKKTAAASKTAPKAAVAKPKSSSVAKKAPAKRAREPTEEPEAEEATSEEHPAKRARTASEAPSQASVISRGSRAPAVRRIVQHKYPKFVKLGSIINSVPVTPLDVFVMGAGESGELGLGNKVYNGKLKPTNVKRPRINHNLPSDGVGVVNIAAGGMHAAVLTKNNTILTWGVNDQWALGRDTSWDGGMRDMDIDSDSDEEPEQGTGMSPHETTPGPVDPDYFLPGTKFVQVVASDSATFALTADGRVYGWGTFRANNGILGFEANNLVQQTPKIVKALLKIKKLAAGDNHILALDAKGKVWAWGDGEQQQLGRRVQERVRETALIPTAVGVKNVVDIACGRNHSFAIDKNNQVWAWGANNFGQCGITDHAGEENAFVFLPTKVGIFPAGTTIKAIAGGNHHSVACTTGGTLLTWGRIDGSMVGFSPEQIKGMDQDGIMNDDRGIPRILQKAAPHDAPTNVCNVVAGTDNSFALTDDGKIYAFGFSTAYQTGLGANDDDIETPTLIENTAVKNHNISWAGCGGQFSIIAGVPLKNQPNGSTSNMNGVAVNGNGVNGANGTSS